MRLSIVIALVAMLVFAGCPGTQLHEGVASDGRPYRGAENAKLTIYEYSDFECPFCSKAVKTVDEVLRAYPDSVRLEYRYFPLEIHPRGFASALAGACAEKQGKFWPMHDLMFANQQALEEADLEKYAQQSGMDVAAFKSCLSSSDAAQKVNKDWDEGRQLGVGGTPTFFIGQSSVIGNQPISKFREVIDSELARVG